MLRTVLDTNIYISALFGGHPEDVYRAALRGRFILLSSPAILAELATILREKFAFPEEDVRAYIKQIGQKAEVVKPKLTLRIVADEPDNRILECAVAGEADLIVSGDFDLLSLKQYEGIGIVRPIEFLRSLGPSEDSPSGA